MDVRQYEHLGVHSLTGKTDGALGHNGRRRSRYRHVLRRENAGMNLPGHINRVKRETLAENIPEVERQPLEQRLHGEQREEPAGQTWIHLQEPAASDVRDQIAIQIGGIEVLRCSLPGEIEIHLTRSAADDAARGGELLQKPSGIAGNQFGADLGEILFAVLCPGA